MSRSLLKTKRLDTDPPDRTSCLFIFIDFSEIVNIAGQRSFDRLGVPDGQ
jgi:hypothetical protein